MSGFPFPSDQLAMARLDGCRPEPEENAHPLTCILRSRQCGNHIHSSGDAGWVDRAIPILEQTLVPPEVRNWGEEGAEINGVCHLLSADRHAQTLWRGVGSAREKAIFDEIARPGVSKKVDSNKTD